MKYLKEQIFNKFKKVGKNNKNLQKIDFNKSEFFHILVTLIHEKVLSYEEYLKLLEKYRKRNKNINILRITSPRAFGEKWAENHLREVVFELNKDEKTKGAYDLGYKKDNKNLKIEVKASRVVDRTLHDIPYHERALVSTDKKGLFDMNFQQMKPTCFDVIIMVGVWSDKIKYWLMTSKEIKKNKHFSTGQHRGNKGYEGQMHIKTENIQDFKKYEITPSKIAKKLSTII